MRVLAGLALAGLRHRVGLWVLLALGVALAAGLPVFAAGLRQDAAVAAVRTAVDQIPAASRAAMSVTSTTMDGATLAEVDSTVRDGFSAIGLTDVRQTMTFRPLAVGGSQFALGAVDDLRTAVRLDSGRWPASCTPTACEVVAVALSTTDTVPTSAQPAIRSQLGVTVTGTATLLDDRLIGVRLLAPDVPLLLGGDPTALSTSEPLALFGRATGWIGTLDGTAVAARGAQAFAHDLAAADGAGQRRRRSVDHDLAGRHRAGRGRARDGVGGPLHRPRGRRRGAAAGLLPGCRGRPAAPPTTGRPAPRAARRRPRPTHRDRRLADSAGGAGRDGGRGGRRGSGGGDDGPRTAGGRLVVGQRCAVGERADADLAGTGRGDHDGRRGALAGQRGCSHHVGPRCRDRSGARTGGARPGRPADRDRRGAQHAHHRRHGVGHRSAGGQTVGAGHGARRSADPTAAPGAAHGDPHLTPPALGSDGDRRVPGRRLLQPGLRGRIPGQPGAIGRRPGRVHRAAGRPRRTECRRCGAPGRGGRRRGDRGRTGRGHRARCHLDGNRRGRHQPCEKRSLGGIVPVGVRAGARARRGDRQQFGRGRASPPPSPRPTPRRPRTRRSRPEHWR